jgi:hypothetical protein
MGDCQRPCCLPTVTVYHCWCGSKTSDKTEQRAAAVACLLSPVRFRVAYVEVIGGPRCLHVIEGRTCPAEDQLLDHRRKAS